MKFAEFRAEVADDFAELIGKGLPAFFNELKAELASRPAKGFNLASVEAELAYRTDREVYRCMEDWMRRTAAKAPEICPSCDAPLESIIHNSEREVILQTGRVNLRRSYGWCPNCQQWRCPTDNALHLTEVTNGEKPGKIDSA